MRKKSFFAKLLILALISVLFMNILGFSAFAAQEPADDGSGYSDTPADDGSGSDSGAGTAGDGGENPGQGGELDGDPVPDEQGRPTEQPEEPTVNEDEFYGYGQATEEPGDSSYSEPEYLDELPTTVNGEVVEATAVVIPKAPVSDASLLSGIIMWLCVAVGIAVVVGVMVSKRTHRRSV